MSAAPEGMDARLHRMGRSGTIAIAVTAVLLLAFSGLIAGALMSSDRGEPRVIAPGGPGEIGAIGPGEASSTTSAHRGPVIAGTFAQEITPGPGETPTPAPEETVPVDPTAPADPLEESAATLFDGDLSVTVVPPWEVRMNDDNEVLLGDGSGGVVYGLSGTTDIGTTAESLLATVQPDILSPENYTQLTTTSAIVQAGFGSVTGIAYIGYGGMYTDAQGTYEVWGDLWVAVRNDGAALALTAEYAPPEGFDGEGWRPVIEGTLRTFAGL